MPNPRASDADRDARLQRVKISLGSMNAQLWETSLVLIEAGISASEVSAMLRAFADTFDAEMAETCMIN